jgi:signal transduction histidine kinase/CheY-like chemotaxis protein
VLPDAETIMEKNPELREIAIEKLNKVLREYSGIVAQSGPNLGTGYYCKALNAIITYDFQNNDDRVRLLEVTKENRKKQGQPEKFSNTLVGMSIHDHHPGRRVMGQRPDENEQGKWKNIISKEDWKEWNEKYKKGYIALPSTTSLVRSGIYNAQYPILERDDNGRIPNTETQNIRGYIWVNEPSDNVENEDGDKLSRIFLTTFIVDVILIVLIAWIFYKTAAVERRAFALSQAAKDSQKNFLAHMSHEIRTPLNGVIGIVGLLDHTQLDDKQKEYVSLLDTSADHLLMLINDILDFSKIEAGKLELEQIPFNVTEVLEAVVKIVSPKAMEKGIELSYEIICQVPAIIGDPLRIRQILVNFMNNALKFTKRGSIRVVFSVKKAEERSLLIRFAVIDTGIGIPKNRQDQLFGSFTQVDASSARKYGGTGLGLAISKELVEMMNGTIGVESEEGTGSTFWCEIPFPIANLSAIGKDDSYVAMPSQTEGGAKNIGTILVAEDNNVNQIVISEILKQGGLQFDLVGDGQQVLDAVEKKTYAMILMDCHMPVMDGFEAVQVIRQRESAAAANKHIPIIALTASATKDDKELCLSAGMDGYCTKPIELNKLIRVIHKTLNDASASEG